MMRLIWLVMTGFLLIGSASAQLPASREASVYPGTPGPPDAPLTYESALGYVIWYDAEAVVPPEADAGDGQGDVFTAAGTQDARLTISRSETIRPLQALADEVEAALRAEEYSVLTLDTEGMFGGLPALGLSALRGDEVAECYVIDTAHAQFTLRIDFPVEVSDTAGEALFAAASSFTLI